MRCKPPYTRTCFDKSKFRWTVKVFPHFAELSRQQPSKDGMNIHASVVIGEARGFRLAVIAVDRMIQAFAHEIGECDGPIAADTIGK